MKIQESAENYLETILVLTEKNGLVRSIDIANELNFKKPSISRAVKLLKGDGYITVDDSGYIHLTDSGLLIAKKVYERHKTVSQYLIKIGVDEETALNDACRIEHIISNKTFEMLKLQLNKLEDK